MSRLWAGLVRETVDDHGWAVTIACAVLFPIVLAATVVGIIVGEARRWARKTMWR